MFLALPKNDKLQVSAIKVGLSTAFIFFEKSETHFPEKI
jgi:hypothetical protein